MTSRANIRLRRAAAVLVFLAAAASCGSKPQAPPAVSTEIKGPMVTSVAAIFPIGEGRDKVLSVCGTCHPVVCAAKGQRTADNWQNVKASHKDKLTDAKPEDVDTMFAYLAENFNDKKPEPQIPAEWAQQGCTPY